MRSKVGTFPLTPTVLNRDYHRGLLPTALNRDSSNRGLLPTALNSDYHRGLLESNPSPRSRMCDKIIRAFAA